MKHAHPLVNVTEFMQWLANRTVTILLYGVNENNTSGNENDDRRVVIYKSNTL